jgi:hypothetical protein
VAAEQSGAHVSGFSTRLVPRTSMAVPRPRDKEATVRVRSLSAARAYSAPAARRRRQLLIAAIAALALLLGLVVGVASSHGGLSLAAKVSALSHGDVSQAELQPARPRPAPAPARVLRVSPARASTRLDGMHLGRGDVRLPETDASALHELRVSAPGYVPRVVLFRGAPSDLYIALEPAP